MREDDRLPRFNRYSIPPREGSVPCSRCASFVMPGQGMIDHFKAKHPGELPTAAAYQWQWREGGGPIYHGEGDTIEEAKANAAADPANSYEGKTDQ
jgi:hypothetical protein